MIKYKKPASVQAENIYIKMSNGRRLRVLIVKPKDVTKRSNVGVLWIHGGGYVSGMPEMVYMSRAIDLVTRCGATIISPAYTLSFIKPYPTALYECHETLLYVKNHAEQLAINPDQIMVGGESAGGGLCTALCMYARDHHSVNIAFQMPLYPMLDCCDTESSKDNHEKVWNTTKNHLAWRIYLRGIKNKKKISPYASPSRMKDYSNLPPCYTFVGDIEPFYDETLTYVNKLLEAGVAAHLDIYPNFYHAFDMMNPEHLTSKMCADVMVDYFNYAKDNYFAKQDRE